MSITLFIRKGAARQRVKLSARAYYLLPDNGGKIDFCIATSCYVNRIEFNAAIENSNVMATFLNTEDGKRYNEFRQNIISKCDSYVQNGGRDIEHLKKIIMGDAIDLPKYFDSWWEYCIKQWEDGNNNEFLTSRGKHKGGKLNTTTLSMYRAYYNTLCKFVADTKRIHLTYNEVNQDLVNEIDAYLRQRDLGGNSRSQFFTVLNIVAKKAAKRGLLHVTWDKPAINSARSEAVKPVYLTSERINDLYNHKFNNKKLQEVADIFVIGALCGQRHSDYSELTSKNIVVINGVEFLDFTQKKTSKHLYVPCDSRVKAILAKYGGQLPKVNIMSFNTRIKLCGAEMGWNESVKVDAEDKGLRYVTTAPFYTQLGSHTARRSMLTNMYESGVSLANIMRVSGHSSEQMLRKYLCLTDKQDAIELIKSGYFASNGINAAE